MSEGRVVYTPPKEHRCHPGIDLQFASPGTIYECPQGHTWVAYRQRFDDASPVRIFYSLWRSEGWWEKRKRLKAEARKPGRTA
jgi:hypothetical protein